jgi:hypothetical protein
MSIIAAGASPPSTTGGTTLTFGQTALVLGLVVAGALLAGLIIILARKEVPRHPREMSSSVIRSWLAISLVFGLLVFCGAAFEINDPTLRSTLLGGLVASVGAAVAFYFSSKGADQARSDVLGAAVAIAQGATAPSTFLAASPPAGNTNAPYPAYAFKADGHPAPTYSIGSGELPDGLTLDPSGTLRGTPTSAGSKSFSVLATNVAGSLSTDVTLVIN